MALKGHVTELCSSFRTTFAFLLLVGLKISIQCLQHHTCAAITEARTVSLNRIVFGKSLPFQDCLTTKITFFRHPSSSLLVAFASLLSLHPRSYRFSWQLVLVAENLRCLPLMGTLSSKDSLLYLSDSRRPFHQTLQSLNP